ncbi:MAG: flagellar basal body rod protein FlgB [Pseudomonadota bacterium]|jgi:flagellar basal-body rod protein FlgB
MDLNSLGLFQVMSEKMSWHNQRQEILARNVANSDTPGYRPQDIVGFDFRKELREADSLPMAATQAGHLTTAAERGGFRDGKARRTYETAPAGNAVVLEEQMMLVGKNAMDYQLLLNIYRKQVGMLRTAIGRAGGQ